MSDRLRPSAVLAAVLLTVLTRELLRFVLSREGQQVVVKDGYLPLPAQAVQQELAKIK